MKIYEIGTGYTPIPAQMGAATEIVVEELTKAMLKQGHDVQIVDIKATDRRETDLPILEVPVAAVFSGTDVALGIMHKLKRVGYSVSLAGVLKKILQAADEKVIFHFHNQYNLFFFLKLIPATLRRKCLIAYTNHSGIWRLEWSEIKSIIKKRYFQEVECMKQADLVFLLNEETKRNVLEHLGIHEGRIMVINNGVNIDVYHPLTKEEKCSAREKWGLCGKHVILQVGSVYENKGQLRSAEYLLPLLKTNPHLVYAYVGGIVDVAYQTQIQNFVRENSMMSQIRYLGTVSPGRELNELYNTAAATILPSRYEGFSLVSIESCASGVPVLVDRMGPVRLGKGSVIYDSRYIKDAVTQVILDSIADDGHLGTEARNNAVDNYSWDRIAAGYVGAFENATADRG